MAYPPIPPRPHGYFIVGSKFSLNDESSQQSPKTDPSTQWGQETGVIADLVSGYCWNQFLNARGYGVLTVYLKDADLVAPDELVVSNGWTFIKVGPPQQVVSESPPNLRYPDPRQNIWTMQNDWFFSTSNFPSSEVKLAAHFETWDNAAKKDGYGKVYFDVRPAQSRDVNNNLVSNGLNIAGGWMSIGTQAFAHTYTARNWGGPPAHNGSNGLPPTVAVASCRTWPTLGLSYAGHDYDNANGFAYVNLAPSH